MSLRFVPGNEVKLHLVGMCFGMLLENLPIRRPVGRDGLDVLIRVHTKVSSEVLGRIGTAEPYSRGRAVNDKEFAGSARQDSFVRYCATLNSWVVATLRRNYYKEAVMKGKDNGPRETKKVLGLFAYILVIWATKPKLVCAMLVHLSVYEVFWVLWALLGICYLFVKYFRK